MTLSVFVDAYHVLTESSPSPRCEPLQPRLSCPMCCSMPFIPLSCHPSTPSSAVDRIAVCVCHRPDGILALEYRIEGRLDGVRWPSLRPPLRVDGLWRHTCFEAFLAEPDTPAYYEFNFAPSTEWTCYRFTGYRQGQTVVGQAGPPSIVLHPGVDCCRLAATVDLTALTSLRVDRGLRLALSAVVETVGGDRSYWALRHPHGQPDFHHPDGFALALDLPASEK